VGWKRLITTEDFTEGQITSLQGLVFDDPTVTLSLTTYIYDSQTSTTTEELESLGSNYSTANSTNGGNFIEKGQDVRLSYTFKATSNSDTFVSSEFDSVELNPDDENVNGNEVYVTQHILVPDVLSNITKNYKATFTTKGTKTATKTAYVRTPRYLGSVDPSDFNTLNGFFTGIDGFDDSVTFNGDVPNVDYSTINDLFTKILITSTNISSATYSGGTSMNNSTIAFTNEGGHVAFITTVNNLTPVSDLGFPLSVGLATDGDADTKFFLIYPLKVKLINEIDLVTMYLYKTREVQGSSGNSVTSGYKLIS
jgi:hypothetical protein